MKSIQDIQKLILEIQDGVREEIEEARQQKLLTLEPRQREINKSWAFQQAYYPIIDTAQRYHFRQFRGASEEFDLIIAKLMIILKDGGTIPDYVFNEAAEHLHGMIACDATWNRNYLKSEEWAYGQLMIEKMLMIGMDVEELLRDRFMPGGMKWDEELQMWVSDDEMGPPPSDSIPYELKEIIRTFPEKVEKFKATVLLEQVAPLLEEKNAPVIEEISPVLFSDRKKPVSNSNTPEIVAENKEARKQSENVPFAIVQIPETAPKSQGPGFYQAYDANRKLWICIEKLFQSRTKDERGNNTSITAAAATLATAIDLVEVILPPLPPIQREFWKLLTKLGFAV